jgi:flagellin-like hook-associated protein FlgL
VAIRNNQESGNVGMMHNPLATLAIALERFGRYEPAATIAGFAALNPMVAVSLPELAALTTRLREILGNQAYESLARKGEAMTIAAIATYAYEQIDQARTELGAVSE